MTLNVRMLEEDTLWDITYGAHPDFETVEKESIDDQGRWWTGKSMVIKERETMKYYRLSWLVGSTEMQEQDPEFTAVEVKPVEKIVTVYE